MRLSTAAPSAGPGNGLYGIVVAVSVEDLPEESLRALSLEGQPVGRDQPTGVGLRIRKGEDPAPQVVQGFEALVSYDQVGVVVALPLDLGTASRSNPNFPFPLAYGP